MSVIQATSGTYRSRVDGTIVLSVEISPMHRAAALELFGMPGQPMALAALTQQAAKATAQAETIEAAKPNTGRLSQWAAMRCEEPMFREWVGKMTASISVSEQDAKEYIYKKCAIESRSELDTDNNAAKAFHTLIRERYAEFVRMNHQNEKQPF